MKKTLILMRHAKTEQAVFDQKDFDRALLPRGKNDAQTMAERLYEKGFQPEIIITSTAKRTQQTTEIISKILKIPQTRIHSEQQLYLCATHTIEDIVMSLPKEINTCMLIAHNPGISEFVYESNSRAIISELATSGIVVFSFETDNWYNYPNNKKKIEYVDYPKKKL